MQFLYKGRSGDWLGRVLSIWSALATILILIGMVALPILARGLIEKGEEALSEASKQAGEIAQIVAGAENALVKASGALDASASALEEAQTNLENIEPLLVSIQSVLGEEAPSAIVSTRSALESAQSGARAMDQMLRVLSSLRFLTGVSYAPEQPLDEALLDVSDSLMPMPSALIAVSEDIDAFGQALDGVSPEMSDAIDGIGSMSASLRNLSSSISTSVDRLESLAGSLAVQAQKFGHNVWIGVIIAELLLLQIALLQLVSGYIGGKLLRESH